MSPVKYEESKHKRSQTGQFAAKPKARLSGPTEEPKVKVTPVKKSAPVTPEMRTLNQAKAAANRKRLDENRRRAAERRKEIAHAERVAIRNQRALQALFPKQAAKNKREATQAGKDFLRALAEGNATFEEVNARFMPAYQKRTEWNRGLNRNIMSRIQAERRRLWQEKKDIWATPELQAIKKGGTEAEQAAERRAQQRAAWEKANPGAVKRQAEARRKAGSKGSSKKGKTKAEREAEAAQKRRRREQLEREYAWITEATPGHGSST